MKAGESYRVAQAFTDYDKFDHPIGEEWEFLGSAFLPYDDGYSLFVSKDGEREWMLRVQDREDEQAELIRNFENFVTLVSRLGG